MALLVVLVDATEVVVVGDILSKDDDVDEIEDESVVFSTILAT